MVFDSTVTSMALFCRFRSDFFKVAKKKFKMVIVKYLSEMFMKLDSISHRRLNCIGCE